MAAEVERLRRERDSLETEVHERAAEAALLRSQHAQHQQSLEESLRVAVQQAGEMEALVARKEAERAEAEKELWCERRKGGGGNETAATQDALVALAARVDDLLREKADLEGLVDRLVAPGGLA